MKSGRDWTSWGCFEITTQTHIVTHQTSGKPFPEYGHNINAYRRKPSTIFTIKTWGSNGWK